MTADLTSEAALRDVYPAPTRTITAKILDRLEPHSRRFIAASPFLCIGSSRPDGLADVSPRGGEPGFVHVLDDRTLAMPDRPGNNIIDTMTNIVRAPAVGLLFFVPGVEFMLRVNGEATVSMEPALLDRFVVDGKPPRSVMTVAVREVYLHCSKAIRRSGLWTAEAQAGAADLPTLGTMLRDQLNAPVPAAAIDAALDDNIRRDLY